MNVRLCGLGLAPSFLLAACSLIPGPMDIKCERKWVRDFAAPDGKRKAVEYHSVCEGGFYHSTIEVADGDGRNAATAMHANLSGRVQSFPELKVEWKSGNEVWIKYPENVDAQCISSPPGVAVHCVDASIVRQ